jgi:hypothetical protein
MNVKDLIVNRGTGAITIHEDDTITIDERLKDTHTSALHPSDYVVSKEAIFNLKKDIESFEPYISTMLTKVMFSIKDLLLENGVNNPKPYMARCYRNNIVTPWHKHGVPKGVKPSKFWVAIYYMHPNWDSAFGGNIKVGLTEKETVLDLECTSNSVVMHNGYYGHGVEKLRLGYEGDRDIFLTHWVNEG